MASPLWWQGWGTGPATAHPPLGLPALPADERQGLGASAAGQRGWPQAVQACAGRRCGPAWEWEARACFQKAPGLKAASIPSGPRKGADPPVSQAQHGGLGEGVLRYVI